MAELLSTADAARLAGVGTTSVKRWADLGLLPCTKTAGGHRRFAREDVERVVLAFGGKEQPEHSRYVELMLDGSRYYELRGALLTARGQLGAWHRVADQVGRAVTELGARWESGKITVLEEHAASEALERALTRTLEELPIAEGARTCLLACADGEEHTLGLSLAELCLRELGWQTVWAGRKTPIEELVHSAKSGELDMVALSASESSKDARALARQVERVGAACRAGGVALVLGGGGAWPESTDSALRFRSFEPFHEYLARSSSRAASKSAVND